MEKLIEKLEELKEELDNTALVKDIKILINKIDSDKDLVKLIEDYSLTKDEKLKERIISNKLFQEYKEKETDLNILIMEIQLMIILLQVINQLVYLLNFFRFSFYFSYQSPIFINYKLIVFLYQYYLFILLPHLLQKLASLGNLLPHLPQKITLGSNSTLTVSSFLDSTSFL